MPENKFKHPNLGNDETDSLAIKIFYQPALSITSITVGLLVTSTDWGVVIRANAVDYCWVNLDVAFSVCVISNVVASCVTGIAVCFTIFADRGVFFNANT